MQAPPDLELWPYGATRGGLDIYSTTQLRSYLIVPGTLRLQGKGEGPGSIV